MPFVDTRTLDSGTTIEADLCVVGAGPAGMALALEFDGAGRRVALLESGGLTFDLDTQDLATGASVGVPYPPLNSARLRFFGGTSNHWGGNVKALDPIDFEERDWIPHSGWPIGANDLTPYYERARRHCDFPEEAYDKAHWERAKDTAAWSFTDDAIRSDVFLTVGNRRLRFGTSLRDHFATSANVTTYLYTNATQLQHSTENGAITLLKAKTLDGKSIAFKARRYVLAAGGIENPRLLLLSPGLSGKGIGNEHDLVGRFFMEHLTIPKFCTLVVSDPWVDLGFYRTAVLPWGDVWGTLNPTRQNQIEHRLTNCRFQLATLTNTFNINMGSEGLSSLRALLGKTLPPTNEPDEFTYHLANVIAGVDHVASAAYERLRYHPDYPLISIEVVSIGEQVPNPDSRVRLGDERDRLGQRRVVLDWRLAGQDTDGVRNHARFLARQLGQSGYGRLVEDFSPALFEDTPPRPHIHHMGTTRMNTDPRRGVVDANCLVHGTTNLYIAGSSVFPTGGNVNPTYTILALAARLADHLKAQPA